MTVVRDALETAGVTAEQAGHGVVLGDEFGPFANVHMPPTPRKYVILAQDIPLEEGFTTIESWTYIGDGVLHVVFGAERQYQRPPFVMPLGILRQLQEIADDDPRVIAEEAAARERAALTIDDVRMVTCDSSVLALGITPTGFAPRDGLMVSAAIIGELARFSYATLDGEVGVRFEHLSWIDPIPVDDFVLQGISFFSNCQDLRPRESGGVPLSGGDLLCAATAAAYGVPLYTARPEAYAGV